MPGWGFRLVAAMALAGCASGSPSAEQQIGPVSSGPADSGSSGNGGEGTDASGDPRGDASPGTSDAAVDEPSEGPEAVAPGAYRAGDFIVRIGGSQDGVTLSVAHADEPNHELFATPRGADFLTAAKGREEVKSEFASFEISDEVLSTCGMPALETVEQVDDATLAFAGTLQQCAAAFELRFAEVAPGQLSFLAHIDDARFNRVFLSYASSASERFWGFGQQYSRLDLKGELLPVWVQEQGHGRGLEPLSTALGTIAGGASGEWHTTYTSVPFYMSNLRRALLLENTEYCEFDLRESTRSTIRIFSSELRGRLYYGKQPLDILEAYTTYTGRMQPLPSWTQQGAIVRAYAGEEAVLDLVDRLAAADVPLAGLWVEDWMGRRQNLTGTRLWWNWQLDSTIYPNWKDFVRGLADRGIRVLTYFNPYLADSTGNKNHARYLFQEAEKAGYLVKDGSGDVFTFGAGGFDGAVVDLSNPAARSWLKAIMVEHLNTGVSGWMSDFGEALPYDAVLASGETGAAMHNLWPVEWARLNREVLREAGREGDALFWTRSAGTTSPGQTTLAWLGDQTVTWDRYDGMKTVVNALVAASLSGATLIHGDIGGYLAVNYPIVTLRRTKELLLRWVELGAFQALFRTHDTINPAENPQVYSDAESLAHFARFSKLYAALAPYRAQLMEEAAAKGYPLIRHPYLHFPDDRTLQRYEYQFMLGSELMIAPVLDPGVDEMSVYLPAGEWVHLWTGKTYGKADAGASYVVPAPIGRPPCFFRAGSTVGESLLERMDALGLR